MELQLFYSNGTKLSMDQLLNWMEKYLAQLVTLAVQVVWTLSVESAPEKSQAPKGPLDTVHQALDRLANIVLKELSPVTWHKCEHLITELMHK